MVDWFSLAKMAGPLLTGAKSVHDRVRGRMPSIDFAPGTYGAVLHLRNDRDETIIVERIEAKPPLLAFSTGHEVRDIAEAVVRVRPDAVEDALAVLRSKEDIELKIITMDGFKAAPASQKIKVTIQWRASSRALLSRSKASKKITVEDVRDLEEAAEQRRMRPFML